MATTGIVVAFAGDGIGADLGIGTALPAFAQQGRSDAPPPAARSAKPPAATPTVALPAPSATATPAAALSAPADEEGLSAVELLGKRLFEDTNLSEPRGQACASCHEAAKAFTGNAGSKIAAVAAGAPPGVVGNRNVPTAMYARFAPPFSFVEKKDEESGKVEMVPNGGLFLDGRADTLAKQAEAPFLNTREMNNPSKQAVVDKVRAGGYADLMRKVFGEKAFDDVEAAYASIAAAIAAFESTPRFQPFSSKFDAFLRGEAKLTAVAARGALGLASGALVTLVTYRGLLGIPMRHLFATTTVLIALLTAGMAAQAVSFLDRANIVTALDGVMWNTDWLLSEKSMMGSALHTLIGYSDQPTAMQLCVYLATLVVTWLLIRLVASSDVRRTKGAKVTG